MSKAFLYVYIKLFIVVSAGIAYFVWSKSPPDELIKNETEALKAVAIFFGGIAVIIDAYFAAQRAQAMDKTAEGTLRNAEAALNNAKIAEDKQITERFSKAIEQLGSEKIEVRLGAIYTLERIAKDSSKDHWTIMEVLTAFVRHNAAVEGKGKLKKKKSSVKEPQNSQKLPLDIQESLTVIGRREHKERENNFLNLMHINISGAKLSRANLSGANLSGANLSGANLSEASLFGANLFEANLSGADLSGANLSEAELPAAKLSEAELPAANLSKANLSGAKLSEAELPEANLSGANFFETDLSGADLSGADLSGANLSEANLSGTNLKGAKNLTPEQVKSAINYQDAEYDEDFRAQLGLPSQ